MKLRMFCMFAMFLAMTLTTNSAWAIGFKLSQSKKELRLDYDIKVKDIGNGKVSYELALHNPGRLAEISAVNLLIADSTGKNYDVVVYVAPFEKEDITYYRFQVSREFAERGSLHLMTSKLDGKIEPLTWYYFEISLKESLKDKETPVLPTAKP